ncbi:SSI family serine proteinase inhibitor [Sphaerisporangium viridialbum]|uniref:SSI family serine proteinase inhibitor n=1 Tax=Sphaerisporangium viridialbum TaxID=46189 RepID=UPI003C772813
MRRLFTGLGCLALALGTAAVVGSSAASANSIKEPPPGGTSQEPQHENTAETSPGQQATGVNPEQPAAAPGQEGQAPAVPATEGQPPAAPATTPAAPATTPAAPATTPAVPATTPAVPATEGQPPVAPGAEGRPAVVPGTDPGQQAGATGTAPDQEVFAIGPRSRVLALAIHHGDKSFPPDRILTLQCSPPGGSHPKAAEACKALEAVGGDPAKLNVSPGTVCPQVSEPVSLAAIGMWDGGRIKWEHTFGNACLLRSATGPVYAF